MATDEGGIPLLALTATAISRDTNALFPLLAIDETAAVVSIYATISTLFADVGLRVLFGPMYDFGALGESASTAKDVLG